MYDVGGIITPIIHLNGFTTFLYGAGENANSFINYLEANDVKVEGVFDQDISKAGQVITGDICYIHTSNIKNVVNNPDNVFAIIITQYFTELEQQKITNLLYDAGITKYYHINDGDIREVMALGMNGAIRYFREKREDLKAIYDCLVDDTSMEVFLEYLRVQTQAGIYKKQKCPGKNKYFYGLDENDNLYAHLEDEVWCNCGANIGDSIFGFFDLGLRARRIYAYEGDHKNIEVLKGNLKWLPEKLRKCVVPIDEFIEQNTEFEKYMDEQITLLNADIEGAELSMLEAMAKIIVRDRPVIAVCVYHTKEQFVEVPMFISSIVDDYTFAYRKYQSSVIDVNQYYEIVFYAIPNERCRLK